MAKLNTYTIPHVGLKKEVHYFEYQLDKTFFAKFEHSLITKGDVLVTVRFDNRYEPFLMDFFIKGSTPAECDKCAAPVMLQLDEEYRVYVKFDTEPAQMDDELEILFLGRDEPEIDLEPYLYDFVNLSVPALKVCDEPGNTPFCDLAVLKMLDNDFKTNEEKVTDPRWEGLNKLKDLK